MRNSTALVVGAWAAVTCGAWTLSASFAIEPATELSTWTVGTGVKLRATPVRLKQSSVTLRADDGQEHIVKLADLPADERKAALITVVGSGVVVVKAKDAADAPLGMGSGFVFHRSGLILTNYHVVRGAGSIEVETRDNAAALAADLLAVDRGNDVAVLRVSELPTGTHVLELAAHAAIKPGDGVWTIGHPRGLKNTASWGDVNAVRTPQQIGLPLAAGADTKWIQTDTVIAQGSSGGPLLNDQGQAVGINTFMAAPQMAFALHVVHARPTFEQARNAQPQNLPLAPAADEPALAWLSREVAPTIRDLVSETRQARAQATSAEQLAQAVQAIHAKHRAALLTIANQEPKSWPALQALCYACDLSNDGTPQSAGCLAQACESLAQHHLQSRHFTAAIERLGGHTDAACCDLIAKALADSPHAEIRAHAALASAMSKLQWLALEGGPDLAVTKAARDTVESLAARLAKEFANIPLGQGKGSDYAPQLTAQLTALPVGLPAKEITGVDPAGKEFKLSDYKGRVVMLDFFADWCPHCKRMYAAERDMVERLKDRKFALLGVNSDNEKVLADLVRDKVVTWRTWADGEGGPITTSWQISGIPNIFLLDHNGIVRRYYQGAPLEADLAATIENLLKEAEAAKK